MSNIGVICIIVLLVPTLYQVVTLSMKQNERHKEIEAMLRRMEDQLRGIKEG